MSSTPEEVVLEPPKVESHTERNLALVFLAFCVISVIILYLLEIFYVNRGLEKGAKEIGQKLSKARELKLKQMMEQQQSKREET